jgi:hypothetical protein
MHLTIGCKIEWCESVYTPYIKNETSEFIGERTITGRIVNDGYSKKTNYHFFTIYVYSVSGINANDIEISSKIIRRGIIIYPKCKILYVPDNYNELIDKKINKKL